MNATWLDTIRLVNRRRSVTRTPVAVHSRVRFVDLVHAEVRARIEGDGQPTVVFVADPPNVIEHYDALFERLSPRVRVVCFEAPGFGFSAPKRRFTFTFEEYVQVVVDLLGALGMGPYVLAFSCVGAYTALRVAAQYPDLVTKLLLMQAPAWREQVKWARRVDPKGIIATPYIGQAFMFLGERWVMRQWYRAALPKARPVAPFVEPALEACERGARFSLASLFQRWFQAEQPSLGPVTQPALVLWGSSDRSHRLTDKRSILEYVPGAAVIELDGVGHFPELEQPDRFRVLLEDFLIRG